MRIIVQTGKGGVGKTSVSAATALRCADLGYRTLVISTDTAHSLGDALDAELGPEPGRVTDNLDAQEMDVHYSIDKYWGPFQQFMIGMLTRRGAEGVIAEEVAVLPGLEEGASLLWLSEYADQGLYDVIVIDAAPTAETLRLLSLPEVARWWAERFLPLGKTAARFLSPLARTIGMEAPDTETIETIEMLFNTLDDARAMLADSSMSSMRLVVNAERMVIKETQRTYTYLNLYGYPVDAVIANRLIPDTVTDPYFKAWKDQQAAHLDLIHQGFDPLPLFKAPLYPREMGGLDLLRRMGIDMFGEQDPAQHLYTGETQMVEPDGAGGYTMTIPLGFPEKEKLDLYRASDEITLTVGQYNRNIVLPRMLWPLEVASAKLAEDGVLTLKFAAPEED